MGQAHKNGQYLKNRQIILAGNPTCHWCGTQPATQADHLIEVDRGGGHELENLVPSCAKCNNTRAHLYSSAKANIKNNARAEALRDNGIEIKKSTPRFDTVRWRIKTPPAKP